MDPHAALKQSRIQAYDLSTRIGRKRLLDLLERAGRDLSARLAHDPYLSGKGKDSFTATQLRAALAHVRMVTRDVTHGMTRLLRAQAHDATDHAVGSVVEYLQRAEKAFRGVGSQPLALSEARMLHEVAEGVEASILRRIATSGDPASPHPEHAGKLGVLQRYGVETIGNFETSLRQGLIEKKPWGQVRADLVADSPFLQGAPAHWAERIVRTETMGAYNRANWETIRTADDQLGDMCKVLSATFDHRTGADSYAVHGQIRLPAEAFETWEGLMQHPPARPNDREVVVPHRVSWPIPPYLKWKTNAEVAARWKAERRKAAMPPRPTMTTIPLDHFGKQAPPSPR